MQVELWIFGWGIFVVCLAILRSRARRREWQRQPGLTVIHPFDPTFIGPQISDTSDARSVTTDNPVCATTTLRTGNEPVQDDTEPDDFSTPAVHVVPPDVAEFLIPEFRPNLDICQVDLSYPHIDFMHWRSPGMAAMMFNDGSETLTVFFQGLDIVPFDGVFVRFNHPRKGPQSYLLSELLDVTESEISEEEAAWKKDADLDASEHQLEVGGTPMEFVDFDAAKECIEVFVPMDRIKSTSVSVTTTANGEDAQVLVNGRIAAVLVGASEAGPCNVKLIAVDQTAAA